MSKMMLAQRLPNRMADAGQGRFKGSWKSFGPSDANLAQQNYIFVSLTGNTLFYPFFFFYSDFIHGEEPEKHWAGE